MFLNKKNTEDYDYKHDNLYREVLITNRPTSVELSSDNCRTIIQQMSDDNKIPVGRLVFSNRNLSS